MESYSLNFSKSRHGENIFPENGGKPLASSEYFPTHEFLITINQLNLMRYLAIPLLAILITEILSQVHKNKNTTMFTAALFVRTKM